MRSRIVYIESKAESLNGPARIGRVTFSKTGCTLYYKGRSFRRGHGFKSSHFEVGIGDEYWISGPHQEGRDRLYPSNVPVETDADVREEYWTKIRKLPVRKADFTAILGPQVRAGT